MKKKAALLCLALAGALLLLAACTKTEDKEPEDTGEPSPSPTGQISPDPQDSETPSPIPEDDEPRLTAVIYVPDGEAVGFDTVEVPVEGTAQGLLDALIQEGVVDQSVELLSFEMTEEGGEVSGALDLSQAFLTQLESAGGTGERAALYGVANTFIRHYDLSEITITVEGGVIETGHDLYEGPLTFQEQI